MKINQKNNKGNITVEAAIIFPLIFFCIIVVIFVGVFLYQQTLLQSLANRAVERGAATWDNPNKDMGTGMINIDALENNPLYWRVFDSKESDKKDNMQKYIDKRMDSYSILQGTHKIAEVDLKNYVIYKKLLVTVESKYKNPAANIGKKIGYGEFFTIRIKAQSIINDPVELIRNTDFIINLVEDLEEKNPTVAKIGNSMREMMDKIKDSLTKLFEVDEKPGSVE